LIVRAAGAVVWRRRDDRVEMLLVHRPKYGDWSLPKGKNKSAESDEDCAVREVEEETNLRVKLGPELASTAYLANGGLKRVRYWLAEAERADDAGPRNEVDDVAWLPADEVESRLTHERDRKVVRSALEHLAG
jgi:8-oxo-dGTP diphosphatase